MNNEPLPVDNNKSFLKNDNKLVCGMLAFYGLCILGLIGAVAWGLARRSMTLSANATGTVVALATQQAKGTATAVAHATEQAQYKVIDRFDANKSDWRVGTEDNEYWSGYTTIVDGAYLWNVKDSKDGFVSWSDYSTNEYIRDFDIYVDTKVTKGEPGNVCSGLIFRKSPDVSKKGEYYFFTLCNNRTVDISYHSDKDGWDTIETISSFVAFPYSDDWNRMELSARGSHFIFFINGSKVYEMEDERRNVGGLALVIEVRQGTSARILFDNFGFQSR